MIHAQSRHRHKFVVTCRFEGSNNQVVCLRKHSDMATRQVSELCWLAISGHDSTTAVARGSLREDFSEMGRLSARLEHLEAQIFARETSSQTAAAFAAFSRAERYFLAECLLDHSHAASTALALHCAARPYLRRLRALIKVADSIDWQASPNVISTTLIDCAQRLWEKKRFTSDFYELLFKAVREPMDRMVRQYVATGQVLGGEEEFFIACDGGPRRCPSVFSEQLAKIWMVGKTVAVLKRMEEPLLFVTEGSVDVLYSHECRRLVHLILHRHGGLAALKHLRRSIEIEEPLRGEERGLEKDHIDGIDSDDDDDSGDGDEENAGAHAPGLKSWPVRTFLCTPTNVDGYRSVKRFMWSLLNCQRQLSRASGNKVFGALFFLRFRQKALHVLSALLSSLWFRLEKESWESFSVQLVESPDFEFMSALHSAHVKRLLDICLQNALSRPLLEAVVAIVHVCNEFSKAAPGCDPVWLEQEFDQNVSLLRKIMESILQQQKIAHLAALLAALEGLGDGQGRG